MRIVALDVGNKRIGVAVSDPLGIIATPLSVYTRSGMQQDVDAILRIVQEQGAEQILIGMPVSMDGVEREQAQKTQRFVDAVRQKASVPVITSDERLSTVEAERRMREMGMSAERRKALRDAASAAIVLQSYLDSRAFRTPQQPEDAS